MMLADHDIPQQTEHAILHELPPSVIGASVPWFRQRLETLGHEVNPSSALALELTALEKYRAAPIAESTVKYRDAAEVTEHQLRVRGTDFITKALHRADASGWTAWQERVQYLLSGIPNLLARSTRSQARDLAWEILLGAICSGFCSEVSFDEPDLTCIFNGRRIGIAAKMLYSSKPNKQLNKIVEGAKQGEQAELDDAYVICNITDLIPHDKLFEHMHRAGVRAAEAVKEVIDGWLGAFVPQHHEQEWTRRLTGRDALRAVIFFAPTVVPTEALPSGFIYTSIAASRKDHDRDFELAFDSACQSVLLYTTG